MDARQPTRVQTSDILVRPGRSDDLVRINDIYNYYIRKTPITFDLEPFTGEQRHDWFQRYASSGRHRLFVAEEGEAVIGYAGSHSFRQKAAYETTVEVTAYCAPEAVGRGIGTMLYTALFEALAGEDLRMAVAGITLPNTESVRLHERFGFSSVGVFHNVGFKFDTYWDVGWYEKSLS